MSELIEQKNNCAIARWQLLASVSGLAIAASISTAVAEDSSHPVLWIELGGTADAISGLGDPFAPDFTQLSPTPAPYTGGNSPLSLQKPARHTFGGEVKLTLQPPESDWKFSAGVKFGRSKVKRDRHNQSNATIKFPNPAYEHIAALYPSYLPYFTSLLPTFTKYAPKFAETNFTQRERHTLLDFQAGKDVGLGLFGKSGSSTVSVGVRLARFQSHSDALIRARPNAGFSQKTIPNVWGAGPHSHYTIYNAQWKSYYLRASADRSFNGIGPSLSWNASLPIAGNIHNGELDVDLGINGAILFGRQKANVHHHTTARYFKSKYYHSFTTPGGYHAHDHYQPLYDHSDGRNRSRSVAVPNLGANIGLSYRIENTSISLGYRTDNFWGAMDGGIDVSSRKTLAFNGLYATVSVGFGH